MALALNNLQWLICHKTKVKLQLHYYIHFQTNALGKSMNPLIASPVMG